MKKFVLILIVLFSVSSFASNIDLYGENNEIKAQHILKKMDKPIEALSKLRIKGFTHLEDKSLMKQYETLKADLAAKIKKEGDYLYVDIGQIYYPHLKNQYSTIEVVRRDQPERLRFANKALPADLLKSRPPHKQDLIEEMIEYKDRGFQLMLQKKISSLNPDCPFFHCFVGFDHPELKPFLVKFKKASTDPQEKNMLLKVLKEDKDQERRRAAAFLVGHFQEAEEIMTTLAPYVLDEDEELRNNVIRVLIFTVAKSHQYPKDLHPFLLLLDSPSVTDRNKSLFLLLQTLQNKASKDQINNAVRKQLVTLLALKQPNNHDPAYEILKQISGKQFKDTDLKAWNKWAQEKAID